MGQKTGLFVAPVYVDIYVAFYISTVPCLRPRSTRKCGCAIDLTRGSEYTQKNLNELCTMHNCENAQFWDRKLFLKSDMCCSPIMLGQPLGRKKILAEGPQSHNIINTTHSLTHKTRHCISAVQLLTRLRLVYGILLYSNILCPILL